MSTPGPGPTKAVQAVTAERRAQAVQMRLAGVDWQTIADRLGYSDRGAACKDVSRALEKARADLAEVAEDLREVEAARLDRMQAALWPAAVSGDTKAVDTILRLMARRASLLGLDAPMRLETVQVRYDIVGINMEALR